MRNGHIPVQQVGNRGVGEAANTDDHPQNGTAKVVKPKVHSERAQRRAYAD